MNLFGFTTHLHETAGFRYLARALLVVAVAEATSLASFSWLDHRVFSLERIREERARIAAVDEAPIEVAGDEMRREVRERLSEEILRRFGGQVLHPYVGFVFDPALEDEQVKSVLGDLRLSEYGFVHSDVLFEPPRSDRIVVGITGGSVGMLFYREGREALEAELRRAPEFTDREIVFATLALPGFKQPQQLFALNYFLVLGAHFDWIVNLDGFNELGLPVVENRPKGVAPHYPRAWYWNVHEAPDPVVRRGVGEVTYKKDERRKLARSCSREPLSYSVTWNLVWRLLDRSLEREIQEAERELLAYRPAERTFAARGPGADFARDEEMYDELVRVWSRSSLQMHRLCEASGIRYFHFLQPNQYHVDSKPMGAGERAEAYSEASPFAEPIAHGYPLLIDEGGELRGQGVRFHDASGIFRGVEEWIYTDSCCHFNEEGNRLLASFVARGILRDLRAEGIPRQSLSSERARRALGRK